MLVTDTDVRVASIETAQKKKSCIVPVTDAVVTPSQLQSTLACSVKLFTVVN
jgi:hypothetical protein